MRFSESKGRLFAVVLFTAASGHWLTLAVSAPLCAALIWLRRSRDSALAGCALAAGLLLLWHAAWPLLWAFTPSLRPGGISPALLLPSCALVPFAVLAVARPRAAMAFGSALALALYAFCLFLSEYAATSGMAPQRMADVLFLGRCAVLLFTTGAALIGGPVSAPGPGVVRASMAVGAVSWLLAVAAFAFLNLPAGKAVPGGPRVAFWCVSLNGGRFSAIRDSPAGLDKIGLFGEVPELLRSYGFRIGSLESLDRLSTRDWDVLFLLTPPRPMSAVERGAVSSFVASGGRLVVAAEHTDLDGNAACYNPLLEEYGIRIAFDTTTGLCGDTVAGTTASLDALGRLLRKSQNLAYNRGASLALHGRGVRPVLCGDWWWSDAGDTNAAERGLMGDEAWSAGDKFGRRILVASCRAGNGGQVVVFADTSPFINRNAVYNGRFIADFFGLLVGLPVVHSATQRRQVYISTEERNDVPLRGFEADAPTGLGVAALRAGFGVQVGSWRNLRSEDVLVISNPRRSIDLDRLMDHVARGGAALVCGSCAMPAFASFVESLGCSTGSRPLGPAAGDVDALEAWELAVPDHMGDVTPLFAQGKRIGGIFKIGRGRLFLICDRLFLSNRNIETEAGRNETNALFLDRVLHMNQDSPSEAGK